MKAADLTRSVNYWLQPAGCNKGSTHQEVIEHQLGAPGVLEGTPRLTMLAIAKKFVGLALTMYGAQTDKKACQWAGVGLAALGLGSLVYSQYSLSSIMKGQKHLESKPAPIATVHVEQEEITESGNEEEVRSNDQESNPPLPNPDPLPDPQLDSPNPGIPPAPRADNPATSFLNGETEQERTGLLSIIGVPAVPRSERIMRDVGNTFSQRTEAELFGLLREEDSLKRELGVIALFKAEEQGNISDLNNKLANELEINQRLIETLVECSKTYCYQGFRNKSADILRDYCNKDHREPSTIGIVLGSIPIGV